jgi:hypothetical protein
LGPTEQVLPEDGDRIQSPKVVFCKINRNVFLDKDRTMDNVQKHNICTNVPSSQTFRSYLLFFLALVPRDATSPLYHKRHDMRTIFLFATH